MRKLTDNERFWEKVKKTDSCWEWVASKTHNGYGQFFVSGKRWRAHRYSYTQSVGKIPPGMETDHLCGNPSCVNPEHLEVVTKRENLARRESSPRFRGRNTTHCIRGHEYTEQNTYRTPSTGRRSCRTCIKSRSRGRLPITERSYNESQSRVR